MNRVEVLRQINELLAGTYGRLWYDARMRVLQDELIEYGAELDLWVEAVKAHIGNTDTDGGNRVGAYPPTPSHILGHIEELEKRNDRDVARDKDETLARQIREWESQTKADKWKAIPLTELDAPSQKFWRDHNDALKRIKTKGSTQQQRGRLRPLFDEDSQRKGKAGESLVFGKIHIEGDSLMIPTKGDWVKGCHLCADTGMAREWYDKDNAAVVYLTDEYKTLPPERQSALKIRPIVCTDCGAGEDAARQFAGALNDGLLRDLTKTRALVQRRQQRERNEGQPIGFEPKVYTYEAEEVPA